MKTKKYDSFLFQTPQEYIDTFDIYTEPLKVANICRALSSPLRIEILKALNEKLMNLSSIAKKFNIQVSSAAFHLSLLEESGLVYVVKKSENDKTKLYGYGIGKILAINIRSIENQEKIKEISQNISLGSFIDYNFNELCGFASDTKLITDGSRDKFFVEGREKAQIIWTSKAGYIVYPISNNLFTQFEPKSIEISLEICSEGRGYNDKYPSDITFSLNDIEMCTYASKGDYGERYGRYTPHWWYKESTKYGKLVFINITIEGIYLNGSLVNSKIKISNFSFNKMPYSKFKIEVKENAVNKGGFNIFGEKFGDYNQAIRVVVKC